MSEYYQDDDLRQNAWELSQGIQRFVTDLDHAVEQQYDATLVDYLEREVATQVDALDSLVAVSAPESEWHGKFEATRARLADARESIMILSSSTDDSSRQSAAAQAREQLEWAVQACQS
jgi:hypothetical protein